MVKCIKSVDLRDQTDFLMKPFPSRPCAQLSPGSKPSGWLRAGVAAAAVLGLLAWTIAPASATSPPTTKQRVTFGIEPASALGPDGRPNLSITVTPGASLQDYVAVLNYSSVALPLQVYATDAIETTGGGFGLLPANVRPTGVGSWITLPKRDASVRVPAETAKGPGQFVVPLTVHVPDNASPGDHVGGVVASLQSIGTNATGQKVVLQQRVGTRVFIAVSGKLTPKLTVTDLHATYSGTLNPIGKGSMSVSYTVTNAGDVDLALGQQVAVTGWFGTRRQAALASVPLLLPGASVSERVVVPGVWPTFLVHTTVTARPYAPVGGTSPGIGPVTATTTVWAIPWTLLLIIALIVLAGFLALWRRSRVRARRAAPPVLPEREAVPV